MPAPTHWLRTNERQWSPRHVGFFDTETRWEDTPSGQIHRIRLWTLAVVDRRADYPAKTAQRFEWGHDGRELARAITAQAKGRRSLWLFAHNLAFDISASGLIDALVREGWELVDVLLAGRASRAHLRRKHDQLWLLDSYSWLRASLFDIAKAIGRRKGTMPHPDDDESAWVRYCAGDTLTLAGAMLELLAWWDREGLGSFTRSGPGCGWNAYRHVTRGKTVLIRTDSDGPAHDRGAIRGGRRDVTRIGKVPGGPFAMLDFEHAYLSVAAACRLPVARVQYHPTFDPDTLRRRSRDYGVIAECEIWTDTPRYPVKVGRDIFYPVGHFRTTLAQPEITWALEHGDVVKIGAGWRHRLGKPLSDWARAMTGYLERADQHTPDVARMAVKQWTRSVVGRFAARSSTTNDLGPALWPTPHLEHGRTHPGNDPTWDLHIGGKHFLIAQDTESDNAYPAVLAWVESVVRVALGRVLEALGEQLWVSADTDGVLVDLSGARDWLRERHHPGGRCHRPDSLADALCDALGPFSSPCTLRPKLIAGTLELAGPQHFRAGDYSRAAGRAKSERDPVTGAERRLVWPTLAYQLAHGTPNAYVRVEQSWSDPGILARRWVLKDGACLPPRAELDPDGRTRLVDWPQDARSALLGPLGDDQAPALLRAVRRP